MYQPVVTTLLIECTMSTRRRYKRFVTVMSVYLFTSFSNMFRPAFSRLSRLSQANSLNLTTSKSSVSNPVSVPNPPKRPLNAFFAFALNKRTEIARSKPGLKNVELVSEIGSAWKSLSPQLKKEYEAESTIQFSNFKNLYLKWWNGLSSEQKEEFVASKEREKKKKGDKRLKKRLRELGMPRRPLNAFNFFMSTTLQLSKDKTNISEQFGKVARSWKEMTEVDKKPYLDMEIKDLERHANEMIAWEKRMEKEGHSDLLHTNPKETSTIKSTTKSVSSSRGSSSPSLRKPAKNTK